MTVDIASEYKKIWELAEEKAELEVKEFDDIAYEDGISRKKYKDNMRNRHILEMLEMFMYQYTKYDKDSSDLL